MKRKSFALLLVMALLVGLMWQGGSVQAKTYVANANMRYTLKGKLYKSSYLLEDGSRKGFYAIRLSKKIRCKNKVTTSRSRENNIVIYGGRRIENKLGKTVRIRGTLIENNIFFPYNYGLKKWEMV